MGKTTESLPAPDVLADVGHGTFRLLCDETRGEGGGKGVDSG